MRLSSSTSGMWKRGMVRIMRHRQTKEPVTDRPNLNHRATSRLYKKEVIIRFLQDNSLNASFDKYAVPARIVGIGMDLGCPHIFGCGDEARIEVRIDVDDSGSAISHPAVEVGYTNCL